MSHTPELTEYTSRPAETTGVLDDALFFERLDSFMQKSLNDVKAFAERESRTYDEMRRRAAEWHAKWLFSVMTPDGSDNDSSEPPTIGGAPADAKSARARSILIETSKVLESLSEVIGVQSFVLAVIPQDPQDGGFLGGSLIGRDFYRGIRGGGAAGATSFKTYAQKLLTTQEEVVMQDASKHSSPAPTARSARQVKVELYELVRSQLRKVSGIRKAEMKWTNPERLGLYGVRLVGWPSDIPAANPSSLKANQNQRLLELVEHGELRFEKTMMTGLEAVPPDTAQRTPDPAAEDFSWAYDADGGGDAAVGGTAGSTSAAKSVADSSLPANDPLLSSSTDVFPDEGHNSFGNDGTWKADDGNDLLGAQHNGMPGFDEYGLHLEPWNTTVNFEDEEEHSPIESRARKRARSSEPESRQT